MSQLEELFGPVIYAYTREQAIEDGVLIDLAPTAAEAGFNCPVACTAAVWNDYIVPAESLKGEGQSETGRMWDMLHMLQMAVKGGTNGRIITPEREKVCHILLFSVLFLKPDRADWKPDNEKPTDDNRRMRTVELKAHSGPGDNAEQVITIMLPSED